MLEKLGKIRYKPVFILELLLKMLQKKNPNSYPIINIINKRIDLTVFCTALEKNKTV